MTPEQTARSAKIRESLGLPPQPMAENSDRLDQIQALLLEIEATGDAVALLGLAQQLTGMAMRLVAK